MPRRVLIITKDKQHIICHIDTDEDFSLAANKGINSINPFTGGQLICFYCGYQRNAYVFKE